MNTINKYINKNVCVCVCLLYISNVYEFCQLHQIKPGSLWGVWLSLSLLSWVDLDSEDDLFEIFDLIGLGWIVLI